MAVLFVLAQQSISTSTDAYDVSQKNLKQMEQIDRVWYFIKDDLKYLLSVNIQQANSTATLPPFAVEYNGDPILVLLRNQYPVPQGSNATDVVRVAYRLEDEILSRNIWYNPAVTEIELARPTKLLGKVETFEVSVMPPSATSIRAPWEESWFAPGKVPLAVKILLKQKDREEMERVFFLQ